MAKNTDDCTTLIKITLKACVLNDNDRKRIGMSKKTRKVHKVEDQKQGNYSYAVLIYYVFQCFSIIIRSKTLHIF